MSIAITQVRNAESLQSDNMRMDVEINHPEYGWIPYTLDPSDADTTINNDEVIVLIGTDFAAYVAPTQAELDAVLAAEARAERNARLAKSDWRASQDVTMSDVWRTYRQSLRDIPSQAGFPGTITWPTLPDA